MVQVILGSAYINKCTIVIVNNSSNNIIKTISFPSHSAAIVELKRMAIKPLKKEVRKQKVYWRSLIVQCLLSIYVTLLVFLLLFLFS